MKAKQLIKLLSEHPDWDVLVASDAEGNDFNKLQDVNKFQYQDEGYGIEIAEEDEDKGWEKAGKKCWVIWP